MNTRLLTLLAAILFVVGSGIIASCGSDNSTVSDGCSASLPCSISTNIN